MPFLNLWRHNVTARGPYSSQQTSSLWLLRQEVCGRCKSLRDNSTFNEEAYLGGFLPFLKSSRGMNQHHRELGPIEFGPLSKLLID